MDAKNWVMFRKLMQLCRICIVLALIKLLIREAKETNTSEINYNGFKRLRLRLIISKMNYNTEMGETPHRLERSNILVNWDFFLLS